MLERRKRHSRISFSPPPPSKHSASFDHQIVLLKILLELSGPLKWKLDFLGRPKLLRRKGERENKEVGGTNKKDEGKMKQIE